MDFKKKLTSGIYMSVAIAPKIPTTILKDDRAKAFLLNLLSSHKDTFNVDILSYAILNSKVFLLLGNRDNNSDIFQDYISFINSEFSNYYNSTFEDIGMVFKEENNYIKLKRIQDLINCVCFIHKTPLHAGLTSDINSYYFSSLSDYLAQPKMPGIIQCFEIATQEPFSREEFLSLHNSYTGNISYDVSLLEKLRNVMSENMDWYNEENVVSQDDISSQIIDINRRTNASFDLIYKKLKLPKHDKGDVLVKTIVKLNLEYKYHFYDATDKLQVANFTNELPLSVIESIISLTGYSLQYTKYSLGL